MADPHRGTRDGAIYRVPANALLAHPGLLALVGGLGVLLALVAPMVCQSMIDPAGCTGSVSLFGWGLAGVCGVAVTLVGLVRYRRQRA